MLLLAGEATIWQLIFWEENIGWMDVWGLNTGML